MWNEETSKAEIFNQKQDTLMDGALMNLHKTNPPQVIEKCTGHSSDGFVYADGPLTLTLFCKFCRKHYDVNKITGVITD